jgi:hypothetical protein
MHDKPRCFNVDCDEVAVDLATRQNKRIKPFPSLRAKRSNPAPDPDAAASIPSTSRRRRLAAPIPEYHGKGWISSLRSQ